MFAVIVGFLVIGTVIVVFSFSVKRHLTSEADSVVTGGAITGGAEHLLGLDYFPDGKISSLMFHAEKGELIIVCQILKSQPRLLGKKGKGGISALHVALFSKDPTAFKTLL
ncbi:MAG: hypothetical protein ABI600_10035, partial [Luteolibacter sp.]